MHHKIGSNSRDIKARNRLLVLQLIASNHGISRVDLAKATKLSKMTVGNIVAELIESCVIEEAETSESVTGNYGRKPILLKIAAESPCICGMLIKRELCQIVLADLDGNIFEQIDYKYVHLDSYQDLIDLLSNGYNTLVARTTRRIIAVGISSVGPVDSAKGIILNPPFFYAIENVPITSIMGEITKLPVFLVNDANAGALAEKTFGIGKSLSNFVYLHIMNGIGSGFVLQNQLYSGNTGQSGEIGHTSIHFSGPKCVCGNKGCLDLYANLESMRDRIADLSSFYSSSPIANQPKSTWIDIVNAGNQYDPLAIFVLDEFCSYIAHALVNTLNLLDLSDIVIGYDSEKSGTIIEDILHRKISKAILSSDYQEIMVAHSTFGGDAPLIGAIALVANEIFSMQLPLKEIEAIYEPA